MNRLNKPEFLLNNKTFQTIYGRNLLHELNKIIPAGKKINNSNFLYVCFKTEFIASKTNFFFL